MTEEERRLRFEAGGPTGNYVPLRKVLGEEAWRERKRRMQRERLLKNPPKKKYHYPITEKIRTRLKERWERIKADPALHEEYKARARARWLEKHPPKPKKPKVLRSKGKFKKHRPKWRVWFAEQLARQKNRCALCRIDLATLPKADTQVDHIVPRAEGGITEETNLWVLCRKCNLDKRAKRTHLL